MKEGGHVFTNNGEWSSIECTKLDDTDAYGKVKFSGNQKTAKVNEAYL